MMIHTVQITKAICLASNPWGGLGSTSFDALQGLCLTEILASLLIGWVLVVRLCGQGLGW